MIQDIAPAVIVGVINRDRICLTKYAHGFDQYALVAGFTEIGETFEETVIREVKEEIVLQSDDYSLTNEMMSLFKSGSFKIPESSTTDSPS